MAVTAWRLSSANGGRVSGSKYTVRRYLLVLVLCWPLAYAGDLAEDTQEHSDIDVSVSLDAGEQSKATAHTTDYEFLPSAASILEDVEDSAVAARRSDSSTA